MPDDIKILTDMLAGLKTKGIALREKETLFIKAQGLDEAIQRNSKEKDDLESDLSGLKDELKELKNEKRLALASVSEKICKKLNDFLPIGEAFFDAFKSLSFGWVYDDIKQPYNSFSGAQKQIFDAALENMLGSNIIIIEGADMDKEHLTGLLEELSTVEKQVFVNAWFSDVVVPDVFQAVEV